MKLPIAGGLVSVFWETTMKRSHSSKPLSPPACHVFGVDGNHYAYDLNTQHLVAVEPELAEVLRGAGSGTESARGELVRARAEGLFHAHRPRMAARRPPSESSIDRDLGQLVLTVTENCNLRCRYCLHGSELGWVRAHGLRQMSAETAIAAVNYYLDRSDPERRPAISFYGGEPLMNLAAVEAVVGAARDHPAGREVVFAIDTNGVLLDTEAIEFVVGNKIHLQISLDGPREIHDRYRRGVGDRRSYDDIVANLDRLLEQDPGIADRMTFVVTLAPPTDLFGVAEFFRSFPPWAKREISGQPNVTVNIANLQGQDWQKELADEADKSPLLHQMDQAREQYLEALAAGMRMQISPVLRALFEPELIRFHKRSRAPLADTYVPGGNCRPGGRKLHVTVDGRFQPCERTGDVFTLGHLATGLEGGAIEVIQDSFHRAVQNRCRQCWALRLCGVCFASMAARSDPNSARLTVPESVCRRVRSQKEETLKMMVRVLALPPEATEWLDQTVVS